MRVVVTGGAGFIGTYLVQMLVERGDDVLVLDDLSVGHAMPQDGEHVSTIVAPLGDVDAERRIVEFVPEAAFHLAALHFIPWCETHPDEARAANVEGTRWLLGVVDRVQPKTLVFTSTVAVYGFHDQPASEALDRAPNSVYAVTKVEGEDLLTAFSESHPEMTVSMARLANVYGVGDPNDHLIPMLARDLGGEIRAGNLWPERDYVHASDVARALMALAELGPGVHRYNVGTGIGTTVETIIHKLAELAGVPTTVVADPSRARDNDGHLVSDPRAIHQATDWSPAISLDEGLAGVLRSLDLLEA